jgi:hypothetical protein
MTLLSWEKPRSFLHTTGVTKGFEKTLVDARELAELEIPALLETDLVHIKRKRKQFTYEAVDEPVHSPMEKFKVNFYFAILDTAIQLTEERFTQIHQVSSVWLPLTSNLIFLYKVHSLQNRTAKQIMEQYLKLEQALQHGDAKYIDASELSSEVQPITR